MLGAHRQNRRFSPRGQARSFKKGGFLKGFGRVLAKETTLRKGGCALRYVPEKRAVFCRGVGRIPSKETVFARRIRHVPAKQALFLGDRRAAAKQAVFRRWLGADWRIRRFPQKVWARTSKRDGFEADWVRTRIYGGLQDAWARSGFFSGRWS